MAKLIGIIDYGAGNMLSVRNAFSILNIPTVICDTPNSLDTVSGIVLPGVGSYQSASITLRSAGWIEPLSKKVIEQGIPFLGICLGFQLMMKTSTEGGFSEGLGWFPGEIEKLNLDISSRVPHVGWNGVEFSYSSQMFSRISSGESFYFTHSYYLKEPILNVNNCITNSGKNFSAGIEKDHIWGTQFHPEKSQRNGLKLLRNFSNMCGV